MITDKELDLAILRELGEDETQRVGALANDVGAPQARVEERLAFDVGGTGECVSRLPPLDGGCGSNRARASRTGAHIEAFVTLAASTSARLAEALEACGP